MMVMRIVVLSPHQQQLQWVAHFSSFSPTGVFSSPPQQGHISEGKSVVATLSVSSLVYSQNPNHKPLFSFLMACESTTRSGHEGQGLHSIAAGLLLSFEIYKLGFLMRGPELCQTNRL